MNNPDTLYNYSKKLDCIFAELVAKLASPDKSYDNKSLHELELILNKSLPSDKEEDSVGNFVRFMHAKNKYSFMMFLNKSNLTSLCLLIDGRVIVRALNEVGKIRIFWKQSQNKFTIRRVMKLSDYNDTLPTSSENTVQIKPLTILRKPVKKNTHSATQMTETLKNETIFKLNAAFIGSPNQESTIPTYCDIVKTQDDSKLTHLRKPSLATASTEPLDEKKTIMTEHKSWADYTDN